MVIEQRPWTPTKRRGPIAAEFGQSPGPACVTLPSYIGECKNIPDSRIHRGPAYSFAGRHKSKSSESGPGSAAYNITGKTNKGVIETSAPTLSGRHKVTVKDIFPGPCEYDPANSTKAQHSAPKYSFGIRSKAGKPFIGPAPNLYNVPTVMCSSKEGKIRSAPAFTISGRNADLSPLMSVPGPGAYDADDSSLLKQSPAFTMRARFKQTQGSCTPGPAAFYPEKSGNSHMLEIPKQSFGIRHSRYLGKRTPCLVPLEYEAPCRPLKKQAISKYEPPEQCYEMYEKMYGNQQQQPQMQCS